MSWNAADARRMFTSLLDTAERQGPQVIRRNGTDFVVLTEAVLEDRFANKVRKPGDKFLNLVEALRPSPHLRMTREEYEEFMEPINAMRVH